MKVAWQVALVAAALAAPAWAQDSVAKQVYYGIGDALWWYDDASGPFGSEQLNTFVVDTFHFRSSTGQGFRIAPLLKSSKTSDDYLSSLVSGQTMSNTLLQNVAYPFNTYYWWNQPGYGVNNDTAINTPGTPITPSGLSNQFAVAFAEFGTSNAGMSINNIIGGLVNYDPALAEPKRLFVARIVAATNAADEDENRSQFGMGGIDSHGSVHYRADGYNVSGPNPLTGNNYFRTRLPARNPNALNVIDNNGASDAASTNWLLVKNTTSHNTPCQIPEQVAGRPVVMGTNWDGQYVREVAPGNLAWDTTHLAPGVTGHKGGISFSHRLQCGGSIGTAAILGNVDGNTYALNLWGVDANGNVVGTPFFLDGRNAGLPGRFDHYHSQTWARGGNGQIAIGRDQNGKGLAAATWYLGDLSYTDKYNAIVVARFDCGGVNQEWTVAAKITVDHASRTLIWGIGPLPIGRLATLDETPSNFIGPSMSAPAMDSVGNIYFLSACELYDDPNNPPPGGDSFFTTGLFRAVYDPQQFTYKLELLFKYYDEFVGLNSGTPYNINYLSLADSNSVDSGTIWSGNILQTAFNNWAVDGMKPANPRTLGGLVLQAGITYDSDGDGDYGYADPNDPADVNKDQEYNVLLYLGPGTYRCDANCDGTVDGFDIQPFVLALTDPDAWLAAYPCDLLTACDINGDGAVDGFDIQPFVQCLTGGQ